MGRVVSRVVAPLLLAGSLTVAGCASASPLPSGGSSPEARATIAAASATTPATPTPGPTTPVPSGAPLPTPVPGGATGSVGAPGTTVPTTRTPWGQILDELPASFPMHPQADIADVPEPVSGSFQVLIDVAAASAWYRDALRAKGYAVEVSQPLEDGGLVLDATADIPECRIQMTFRPEAGSTIITVLVAAGCAGAG